MPSPKAPYYEIRRSGIQGSGAFALRRIPKGTRLIEYTGERISHEEADRRPEFKDDVGATHVVLFTVDKHTIIDARIGGNEAQLFNHSCDGNCEAVVDRKRVYLETTRTVQAGEELTYDYEMEYSGEDLADARKEYPCRCGSWNCRGTLLDLPEKLIRQLRKSGELPPLPESKRKSRTTAGSRSEAPAPARSRPKRGAVHQPGRTAHRVVRTASNGPRPATKRAKKAVRR